MARFHDNMSGESTLFLHVFNKLHIHTATFLRDDTHSSGGNGCERECQEDGDILVDGDVLVDGRGIDFLRVGALDD